MGKENVTLLSSVGPTGEKREAEKGGFRGCLGARHVLALMAFLGIVNVYSLRVCLSVALVAMVNYTDSSSSSSLPNDDQCPDPYVGNSSVPDREGEFHWDEVTQGNILGAFYYGYLTMQIPGGWLADSRLGGKRVFGFGILFTAALTLLTPLAARSSVTLFIALRVLEGVFEGVTYPALHAMLGRWAPVWERSKLVAFIHGGAPMGTVLSMVISGFLCDAYGWPSVFYFFGGLGCLWFVAWMALIYETPAEHPRISKTERDYIESCVGTKEELPTPWKEILTSPAVWCILIARVTFNLNLYILLSCLPMYLKAILKLRIQENGLLSGLPFILCCIVQLTCGFMADYLRKKRYLSTRNTRILFNSVGFLIQGGSVAMVGVVGCDQTLAEIFLVTAIGLGVIGTAGFDCNHLDIAPRFAGVVMGVTNFTGAIPGFLGPAMVGHLTNHNQTLRQWRIVFYISASSNLVGGTIYNIFARGEELPWGGLPPMSLEIEPRASPNHQQKAPEPYQ